MIFRAVSLLLISAVARAASAGSMCTDFSTRPHETAIERIWNEPELIGSEDPQVMRGILVWEVCESLTKTRSLPTPLELLNRLDREYSKHGYQRQQWSAFLDGPDGDINRVLAIAVRELPERMESLRNELRAVAAKILKRSLRLPTPEAIARESKLGGDQETKERIVRTVVQTDRILSDVLRDDPSTLAEVTHTLAVAFSRATFQMDIPKSQRTQPTRPSMASLLDALVRPQKNGMIASEVIAGRYGIQELEAVVGGVFGGIGGLEEFSIEQNRGRFNSYRPAWATVARMEELRTQIEQKSGFLVTSVNAGIPIVPNQLKAMLRLADDLDVPIVVIPTAQILDQLPLELQHPRIYILTSTIENSALSVSNIGILPKNNDPIAGLLKRGQIVPGQIKIVGHPQWRLKVAATGLNHIAGTFVFSTGSLSEPLYPSANPTQLRTAEIAKNNHKNGFLVVTKADARSGLDGNGVANSFHVRPVEWANHAEDAVDGFTDLGRQYFVRKGDTTAEVHVGTQQPENLVRGDLHDAVADQRYIAEYRRLLLEQPGIRRVFDHDSIDGRSHRHWDFDETLKLSEAARAGTLDIAAEYHALIASKNAMLAIRPDLEIIDINANHPRWMIRLLESGKVPQYLEVLNRQLIDELRIAGSIYRIRDPLEWFLNRRNEWLDSLPPDIAMKYAAAVRINDSARVRVLALGVALTVGPRHRQTQLENHGDKGAGGAKGSANAHSAGNTSSVTGDSHVVEILGGWMNVGTSTKTRQSYSMGGYSAWSNGAALIYPDGTKQLLLFQSHVSSLYQRSANGILPPSEFFGGDPLKVRPNDNDVLPGAVVMDQNSRWGKTQQRLLDRFEP